MNPHEVTLAENEAAGLCINLDVAAIRASITEQDCVELEAIREQLRASGIEPTTEALLAHPAATDIKARWASRLRRFTVLRSLDESSVRSITPIENPDLSTRSSTVQHVYGIGL